jgi:hypothetical protein
VPRLNFARVIANDHSTSPLGGLPTFANPVANGQVAPEPEVHPPACCSALWREANCIYKYRYTEDCNDASEQGSKRTERVAGRFCHFRTNAIMRPSPVGGCQQSPYLCDRLEAACCTVKNINNK